MNISSRAGVRYPPNQAAYNVAKRGVIVLTKTMASELREHDITVNTVLPSIIDTAANREDNPEADFPRWVKPDAIARIVLFLTSEDAKAISGAAVPLYRDA